MAGEKLIEVVGSRISPDEEEGRLSKITNSNNKELALLYNQKGEAVLMQDESGKALHLQYTALGKPGELTDHHDVSAAYINGVIY